MIAAVVLMIGWHCPLRTLFGIPCPGCGMSRAFLCVLKGDFSGAFAFHPLFFLVPLMIFIAMDFSETYKKFNKLLLFVIISFFVVYVIRMVLYFPHTSPMNFNGNALVMVLIDFFVK